jgi:hypothetical protein
MTLVVTEVSEAFGCVVVGDSAVMVGTNVEFGAEKVHYSVEATIGFAIWGNACLAGRRVDELISSFVSHLTRTASPRSAGQDLAALLTIEGKKDGRAWEALRGGYTYAVMKAPYQCSFTCIQGTVHPRPKDPFSFMRTFRMQVLVFSSETATIRCLLLSLMECSITPLASKN